MPGRKGEKCADCYFAEYLGPDMEEVEAYFCRRFPPSYYPKGEEVDPPMPITVTPNEWCGEFELKTLDRA